MGWCVCGHQLGNLGSTYYRMSQFDLALDHYERKLAICREIDDRRGETVTLNNIGGTYRELRFPEIPPPIAKGP